MKPSARFAETITEGATISTIPPSPDELRRIAEHFNTLALAVETGHVRIDQYEGMTAHTSGDGWRVDIQLHAVPVQ